MRSLSRKTKNRSGTRLGSRSDVSLLREVLIVLLRRVGAGRPLLGRPYPPLRTVLATCHRTRLSPYLLLAMISFGECATVKLVMALGTEHKGFPPSCCHHALPQCLSLCHVFQFPHVVNLKCPLCRSAIFTLFAVQPLDKLRATERPHVNGGEQVNPRVV